MGKPWVFPRAFLAFLRFLEAVNDEITETWSMENKRNKGYWISLRAYLNHVLENTVKALEKHQQPVALQCWLQREFMLCCHDKAGRGEYRKLMERSGIAPYSVDIFELDWKGWWEIQTENHYYDSEQFRKFGSQLKADWKVIAAAASTQLWDNMEEQEDSQHQNPPIPPENYPTSSSSTTLGGPLSEPEAQSKMVFIFKSLPHAPPDPPNKADGQLDWEHILEDLMSLTEKWSASDPDIQYFFDKFDQVRFLDGDSLHEYPELRTFLNLTCQNISNVVCAHHPALLKYMEEVLSFSDNEAEKEIDMILSWLKQFTE
ncbi:hypothetical protein J3R82DRAFT_9220 [Butyriboletus roseoflavus]|nr:hypothetical protein J3R82DRAFT_9220 [Butyriboletus roseoflavus]